MLSAEVAAAVAGDFATLALLHDAELTPAIVAGLRDVGFPANLALVPSGELALGSCEMIRSALVAAPNEAGAAWYDECAADYAAIYLTGAFGVAPSESFWLTDDHLVCQQPMFDLRALYAADGLVAPDWRRRPDDHLVHELQYIAHRLGRSSSDEDWRRRRVPRLPPAALAAGLLGADRRSLRHPVLCRPRHDDPGLGAPAARTDRRPSW